MDPYLILKWLHVVSATVLVGAGLGTAFQMVRAMRGGEPAVIAATARAVVLADWLFTAPAGLVQPATGLLLARTAGHGLAEPWLVLTYALYAAAFLCWAPVVRLQQRIRDIAAEDARRGKPLSPAARRAYRAWFALGWPAFAALLAIYWLMVARPPLWA